MTFLLRVHGAMPLHCQPLSAWNMCEISLGYLSASYAFSTIQQNLRLSLFRALVWYKKILHVSFCRKLSKVVLHFVTLSLD
jgi:hypothetical protein